MADRTDIDEVRARTDIVSLVERYVTLKRTGGKLKGLCPFHQEKTPSFVVSPEMGRWHCFGQCGEGGDVFKFVQKIENLTFPEALERLALQSGITLTSRQPSPAGTSGSSPVVSEAGERSRLHRVNAIALRFYRDVLARSPVARAYLQERGLAHAAQEKFQIGFAAEDWDGFCRHLQQTSHQSGVSLDDAEKAGLIARGERGPYDRLRGRLIFPIFDVQERPIAFGGRLIAEARPGQPKYWNSPETPVFSKSRTLYGLSMARKAIAAREQAVVVEGYTDVVACHQAGFENVVATLGTALTEDHVQTLARLASVVLLAFDADSAGLKAASRAAQIFEAQEVEVRVLDLPDGEDPDSLLRANKRLVFEQAIENALPLTEYRLKRLIRKGPSETERDRVALFRKALPILSAVPIMVEREQYVQLLAPYHPLYAKGAAFAEEHIRQDVAGYLTGQGSSQNGEAARPSRYFDRRPAAPPPTPATRGATEKAEQHLLRAMVSDDPALAGMALEALAPAEYATEQTRFLVGFLHAHFARTGSLNPAEVLAALDDDPRANLLATLLMTQNEEPLTMEGVTGEIAYLKDYAKEQTLAALNAKFLDGTADADTQRQFQRLWSELKGTVKSAPAR